MSIMVRKAGDLSGTLVVPASGRGTAKVSDMANILMSLEAASQPAEECAWQLELIIGEGSAARNVTIDLAPCLSSQEYELSKKEPIFLRQHLVFFCGRFFLPERVIRTDAERREVVLRVKKAVYDEDTELIRLRSAVANIEAAIEYTKNGPVREIIPDDVKLVVWARDGGACVKCGSKEDLQFDHVIPVTKGGNGTAENVQVLCQTCNLRKATHVVVPNPDRAVADTGMLGEG